MAGCGQYQDQRVGWPNTAPPITAKSRMDCTVPWAWLERFQFSLQQGYRQCPESAEGVAGYWRSNINWKRSKIRIDDPAAILRLRHARRDVPADCNQVFFVGSSLPGAKSLDRPNRDIDEGAFRRSCQAPRLRHGQLGSGPIAGKSEGTAHGVFATAIGQLSLPGLIKANRQA